MKRITLTATLILTVACLALTSSSSSQEKEQGAYVDPNDGCNFFQFVIGDAEDKAQAKKNCESCAGETCRYIAKVYQAPACLSMNCKGNSSSTSEESRHTESKPNPSGGVSFENDAECPAPDCHYESNGRGGRTCRCEVKLERKSSSSGNKTQTDDNESSATLEETLTWLQRAVKEAGLQDYGDTSTSYMIESYKGCSITILDDQKFPRGKWAKIRHSFSLSDLDPLSITQSPEGNSRMWITLKTRVGGNKLRRQDESNDARGESNVGWVAITVSKEMAPRIIKAFKHAVKLCGGKGEPF